jgi:hypothetical protein
MTDRTLCQMEVHPELIRIRRERAERWKRIVEFLTDPQNQGLLSAAIRGTWVYTE